MPSRDREFELRATDARDQLLTALQHSAQAFRTESIFQIAPPEEYKSRTEDDDCTLAVWCLRYSKSEGKGSSLKNLRTRVSHLFTIAAKHAHHDPKAWAKSEVDRVIDKVFPVDGPAYRSAADGEIKTWLHEQLHEYVDEADIAWFKRTPPLPESGPRTTRYKEHLVFHPKDGNYQNFEFRGREYNLTPQAGAIVKVLNEAGGKPVSKAEIQSKTQCGKICDSFRRLDGPQFWKVIEVTKGRKGFYSLPPELPSLE